MEGVKIIQEAGTNKRYAQIEIELLNYKEPGELKDLIDAILNESKNLDEPFTPDEIEAHLRSVAQH